MSLLGWAAGIWLRTEWRRYALFGLMMVQSKLKGSWLSRIIVY